MKDYRIISGSSSHVREEVTKFLNSGWALAGGVSSCCYEKDREIKTRYSQAVTKYFDPQANL